ncbi:hypothetical protein [Pseudomonas avellanae]|uniref:hypothetical protein n=1 Tax=Pseudomonas avellanae TaxID=46257 RepID=UPI00201B76B2|nr:hypothetical protein [Pseudomonas avellanae]UQW75653.1 hypothetical protein L2Y01_07540 [Pseudomonas avellanae]
MLDSVDGEATLWHGRHAKMSALNLEQGHALQERMALHATPEQVARRETTFYQTKKKTLNFKVFSQWWCPEGES